jgi:molybdenum cofactor biosynthesis enzyme MoaA
MALQLLRIQRHVQGATAMTPPSVILVKLMRHTCSGRKNGRQHCFTSLQYTCHGHRRYMKVKLAPPHPTDICKYCHKTRLEIEGETIQ